MVLGRAGEGVPHFTGVGSGSILGRSYFEEKVLPHLQMVRPSGRKTVGPVSLYFQYSNLMC